MPQQALAAAQGEYSIEKPHEIPAEWSPNILAFACHYCAFAAADLAGVMRLPCTGKLDHIYVLRALEGGLDGVFVAG
jgi:F420-non-reducing hydrogenase iron-sulfur subunit